MQDLKDEPCLRDSVIAVNDWLGQFLDTSTVGVLAAHNGNTVDFQYFACSFIRSKVAAHPSIVYTIDTLHLIRKIKCCAYQKATVEEWTEFTPPPCRKKQMSVTACATYVLQKRETPTTFEEFCGSHHDSAADTKGVQVILWDYAALGNHGLEYYLFKQSKVKVYEKLSTLWLRMQNKCSDPVLKFAPVAEGWIAGIEENDDCCSPSSTILPPSVTPVPTPVYTPSLAERRGPGCASTVLMRHLKVRATTSRTARVDMTDRRLMRELWLFFFSGVLRRVCMCTNARAIEPVLKTAKVTTKTSGTGSKHYNVQRCPKRAACWARCLPGCVNPDRGLHHRRCPNVRTLHRHPPPLSVPRTKGWSTLDVGEMIVWCGIQMKMGVLNKKRVSHYWCKREGFGDPIIQRVMKCLRFTSITTNLSFAPPGSKSGYTKYEMVDKHLKQQCQRAMNKTQKCTGDETMIETHSTYAPKVYMERKPIKWGMKVCMPPPPTHTRSSLCMHAHTLFIMYTCCFAAILVGALQHIHLQLAYILGKGRPCVR